MVENTSDLRPHRVTRRELLADVQIGSAILLLAALAYLLLQFAMPRPLWVDLGPTSDFGQAIPTSRSMVLSDNRGLVVWVVWNGKEWLAFDAHVPLVSDCLYQWQPSTGRFEDPCSGAKFAMNGDYLDVYIYLRGARVQNLDRYPVMVRGDQLFVDADRIIHDTPFIARAASPECCR